MAYTIVPNSKKDIKHQLSHWSKDSREEVIKLFEYMKSFHATPINIDPQKKKINIVRVLKDELALNLISKHLSLKLITLKWGNGSTGGRGINNIGLIFEKDWIDAWNGNHKSDTSYCDDSIKTIIDLHDLEKKKCVVEHCGTTNTKRPLTFTSNDEVVLYNPNQNDNEDIGSVVSDITIHTENKEPIYLSLKYGSSTTFFNVGIKKLFITEEIKKCSIENVQGLKLLQIFGIDSKKFCDVFNGTQHVEFVDRKPKYQKESIEKLLRTGIGYNYTTVHRKGKNIEHKVMTKCTLDESCKISNVVIFYGGKTGKGKRIDIHFESNDYMFCINIRDTAGKDGYPNRMMCNFKSK